MESGKHDRVGAVLGGLFGSSGAKMDHESKRKYRGVVFGEASEIAVRGYSCVIWELFWGPRAPKWTTKAKESTEESFLGKRPFMISECRFGKSFAMFKTVNTATLHLFRGHFACLGECAGGAK